MKNIITTKTLFTESYHEISLSDSILEDGLILEVINMEEPKQNVRLELTWEDFDNLKEVVNSYFKPGKGWLELAKEMGTTEVKPLTEADLVQFFKDMQQSREEEYKRIATMEKEAKKSINKICKDHNCTFEELPLELQSIFMQNSMGITPMFGKWFFDNFREKYPEFAYLL